MTEDHNEHDKEARKAILDNIEKYGCHLALLEADNYLPAFVYSIGLFKKYGHPEIICFGLKTEVMASILNHACDMIKEGESFTPYKLYTDFLVGYKIQLEQILYVYHNEDGDWQFHTSLEPDFNDAKLVCLEEITKLDPTINDLHHLQFGWWAWRENKEDEWKYEKRPDNE
jgi:hypothetical protein